MEGEGVVRLLALGKDVDEGGLLDVL